MRKIFLFLMFFAVATVTTAKPVDRATAQRAAENLLKKSVVDATPVQFAECYLFLGSDGQGFALLSADDCVRPVLGYSATGIFPTAEIPHHVLDWIEGRQHDITVAKTHGYSRHSEWDRLLQGTMKNSGRSVSPMITATWDQSFPYNGQCPYDTEGDNNSLVGCVATATAQVMRYWGHPATGRGSHSYTSPQGTLCVDFGATSYDWAHMPNALNALSTQQEIDAVAQLCYHVGVAVDMEYSSAESGARTASVGYVDQESAEKALKTYFRYNPMLYPDFRNRHTGAEWDSLCKGQLDGGRPLIYAGFGPMGGHCYVVDGYDSLGFFHVNWGWNGYFNGYFVLDSLDVGYGYNFSTDCQALMNVFPITIDSPRAYIFGVSEDTAKGTVQGGGMYYTDSMEVMLTATAAPGYRFDHWSSGNPCNPVITSPTRDFSDTAFFVPLSPDTLGFSSGVLLDYDMFDTGYVVEWGIRVPASYFGFRNQIEEVQFYAPDSGLYSLMLYWGENPTAPFSTCDVNVTTGGWHTVTLDAPVPLHDTLPLWITFRNEGAEPSIAFAAYSGQPDGSWIKIGDSWTLLHESQSTYVSWLVRAPLAPMDMVHLSVMPNDINMGDITGGGNYYPGDSVELIATPRQGYRLVEWSTGSTDNPYHFVIECDTMVMAYFAGSNGIDQVESEKWKVESEGLVLTVENPEGRVIDLYDIAGRQLSSFHSPLSTFNLPAPGVYILKSVGVMPKRIVAVR